MSNKCHWGPQGFTQGKYLALKCYVELNLNYEYMKEVSSKRMNLELQMNF